MVKAHSEPLAVVPPPSDLSPHEAADAWSLVVVGGGPCALAIVLRIAREASGQCCAPAGADSGSRARQLLSRTVVIDASGIGFNTLWRRKLGSQGVTALRSPTFVHPHPSRVLDDAMRAFSTARKRRSELLPLPAAKSDASQVWHAPGSRLFDDFCEDALDEVRAIDPTFCGRLIQARVIGIQPSSHGGFELRCQHTDLSEQVLRASRVVVAVGDGGTASWPKWALASLADGLSPADRLLHATQLAERHPALPLTMLGALGEGGSGKPVKRPPRWWELLGEARSALAAMADRWLPSMVVSLAVASIEAGEANIEAKMTAAGLPAALSAPLATPTASVAPAGQRRLLIVGCGLSGAQLASEAIRRGWAHVTLVCRKRVVVRPYDIDEVWMGRHLSAVMPDCEAAFFAAGFTERRELLRQARPGGSVTEASWQQLRDLQQRGRLELRECTDVLEARWASDDAEGECWRVHLQLQPIADPQLSPEMAKFASVNVDAIWLATGHVLDVASVAVLRSMLQLRPRPTHEGLPELTPALRWDEATPLYVTGALAGLQLGPDALNLAGAGAGASRIVSDVLERMVRS